MRITRLFTLLAFLSLLSRCRAGTIFIDGDNYPRHGRWTETEGFTRGWKYVAEVLRFAHEDSTAGDVQRSVVMLGHRDPGLLPLDEDGFRNNGECYAYVCNKERYNCTFVSGPPVADYLDGMASGANNPAVLFIGGDSIIGNRLDFAEMLRIKDRAHIVDQFVNRGGSVMTQSAYEHDWLTNLDGSGVQIIQRPVSNNDPVCSKQTVTITDYGQTLFPAVSPDDLVERAGDVCDDYFPVFDSSVYIPTLLDADGKVLAMVARGALRPRQRVRLDCSESTDVAGDWRVHFANVTTTVNVEFFVPAGVPGNDFEIRLQNALSADTTFTDDLLCTASHLGGVFQASCPYNANFNTAQICFNDGVTETCDQFAAFDINGIGCPAKPCVECPNPDPGPPVCDHLGREYASECAFNYLACSQPGFDATIELCPGATHPPSTTSTTTIATTPTTTTTTTTLLTTPTTTMTTTTTSGTTTSTTTATTTGDTTTTTTTTATTTTTTGDTTTTSTTTSDTTTTSTTGDTTSTTTTSDGTTTTTTDTGTNSTVPTPGTETTATEVTLPPTPAPITDEGGVVEPTPTNRTFGGTLNRVLGLEGIIGVCVAIVVLCAVCVAVAVWRHNKKKNKDDYEEKDEALHYDV